MNNSGALFSQKCFWNGKLQAATVCYEKGIITRIEPDKLPEAMDLGNLVLMPGVIDAHVHINEPGRTEWEGFATATAAAIAGGTTCLADMPLNSSPVTISVKNFEEKLEATKGKLHAHVGFYGGVIPGNAEEIEGLAKAGVLGFKCFLVHSGIDEFPNVSKADLDIAMPILSRLGLPLLAHCEWIEQAFDSGLDENPKSYSNYLESRPKKWENDAVALMIELSRKHNCAVHIVHVSSSEALKLIKEAKEEGLQITAETCPQYILFYAEGIADGDTRYKCAPPIREKANNDLLKNALGTGILDFIGTDHSPAPPEIKELESGNLAKAWGGIAGIQFLLSASWTALNHEMTLEKFIPLITENPARFLKIDQRKGFLKPGFDADFVVWNPEKAFEVKPENILFKHRISPYIGKWLYGEIEQTWIAGNQVFEKNKLTDKHLGTWLKPV